MKVVPRIYFLAFSNGNIHFVAKKLSGKTYTGRKAITIANQVNLID